MTKTFRLLAATMATAGLLGATQLGYAQSSVKAGSGGSQQAGKGNPCKPGGTSKGCKDWILGNPKPPIRPKK